VVAAMTGLGRFSGAAPGKVLAPVTRVGEIRLAICSAGEIWGGVEQCILTLTGGLRDAAIDPLVILWYDGLLAERLRESGTRVEVIDDCGKYDPRTIRRLSSALVRHRINVLHVHGYKATVMGAIAARRCGIKVVKTEHGRLEPAASWADAWPQAKLALNTALDGVASRWLVDAQVFVSRDLRQRAPGGHGRVLRRLIYNGISEIPPPRWPPASASLPRRFNVGIVGRLSRVKGHEDLLVALRALGHLTDLRLHIVGSGPLEDRCRRLCDELGLQARVEFHGFAQDIRQRIASFDLLAMPSLHEGLPYVLLEAMSLGTPIVASRVGGLQEVLDGRDCGVLVPARQPRALAAAIEQLYHNPALRTRIAANARALVMREFGAASMVERYAAVYRQVLSAP
jgi:L-malate glycosyltransferase